MNAPAAATEPGPSIAIAEAIALPVVDAAPVEVAPEEVAPRGVLMTPEGYVVSSVILAVIGVVGCVCNGIVLLIYFKDKQVSARTPVSEIKFKKKNLKRFRTRKV